MERKIGEIFEYNGEWYQTVEAPIDEHSCNGCQGCKGTGGPHIFGGECNGNARKDNKFVIFKKLEKVGKPYEHYEKFYQCYKLPMETEIRLLPNNCYPIGKDNLVEIEIKQKEDMEEKKQCGDTRFRTIARAKEHLFQATNIAEDKKELEVLDSFLLRCWQMGWLKQYEDVEEKKTNLSPFDIQKAREGKPVCTRDGRKARIICFDAKGDKPIIALVEMGTAETPNNYPIDGKAISAKEASCDLMMLTEKKEGWVNVYSNCLGGPYESKECALKQKMKDCIDTVKISWEE